MTSSFWKTVGVVFVGAFAANVLVSWGFDRIFPGSSWHWDTTTATAAAVAIVVTLILRRRSNRDRLSS